MQMLGAVTGAALVKAINNTAYVSAGGGANQVGGGLTTAGAWGLETISTFMLVFTVLNATDGVRYSAVAHLPVRIPLLTFFLLIPTQVFRSSKGPGARPFSLL